MNAPTVSILDTRLAIGEVIANAQSELVAFRNPTPFAVTEANAENITVRKSKGGLRPLTDSANPKDKGTAASYRAAAHALACRIADKHVRQAKTECAHLRAEFVAEVESAVGEFFAIRLSRFPKLAGDLLARFGADYLPSATVRALHRCTRQACDTRMRRMGGKSKLVEPSFFNVFTAEPEQSAELNAVFVNARIDYLLGLVRAKSGRHGCGRAAQAHAKLLEEARAYFLASIAGDACELPSAGLVPDVSEVGFNVATLRAADKNGRPCGPLVHTDSFAGTESYVVTEPTRTRKTRGETRGGSVASGGRLANSALYKRLLRLSAFTGAQDVRESLARVTGKLTGAEG